MRKIVRHLVLAAALVGAIAGLALAYAPQAMALPPGPC